MSSSLRFYLRQRSLPGLGGHTETEFGLFLDLCAANRLQIHQMTRRNAIKTNIVVFQRHVGFACVRLKCVSTERCYHGLFVWFVVRWDKTKQ